MQNNHSRRAVLKGLAAASAAGALAPAMAAVDPCKIPAKWDLTTEVLVIGSGGAGLASAVSAAQGGAKVTVMEKLGFVGGNTMLCSGYYNCVDPKRQEPQGIKDSVELHVKQTLAAGDYRADPELVRMLAEGAPKSVEWLKKIGVHFRPGIYQIYGGLWPRCRNPEGQSGSDYIKACVQYAKKISLDVKTGHKVTRIIRQEPNAGRVLGVEVEIDGKKENWRAMKGVVAAAGGYAANAQMCAFFDPRLEKLNTTNQPCSTGEVLRSIQDINGLAVGMDYIQCIPWTAPGYKNVADVFQAIEYTIFVNKEGKRYVAEDNRRDVIRDATLAQTDQTVYQVTDVVGFEENNKFYNEMNHVALKNGTLFAADTIEELAKKVKLPPEVLKKTVEEYMKAFEESMDYGWEYGLDENGLMTSNIKDKPREKGEELLVQGAAIEMFAKLHAFDKAKKKRSKKSSR